MKAENRRLRHFNLVLYCSESELDKILIKYSERIHHCCSIVHDKCVYDSDLFDKDGNYVHRKGEKEKVHIHLLISFYNAHTFTAVKRLFTTQEDKPRVEPINDMVGMFRYLTHLDHPNKYQYPSSAIMYHFDEPFYKELLKQGEKTDRDNISVAIVKDILRGVDPMVMLYRYGRDFGIHMRQYKEVADECLAWKVNHPSERVAKALEEDLVQMGLLD